MSTGVIVNDTNAEINVALDTTIANSLNVSSDYLIGRIDTPVPESTVVGNLISELTTEEVIYLVSILSRYVEILKKAGTDRNENSSV